MDYLFSTYIEGKNIGEFIISIYSNPELIDPEFHE